MERPASESGPYRNRSAGWKPSVQNEKAPIREPFRKNRDKRKQLVAGDGLGSGFFCRSWGDVHGLIRVGEVGRNGFSDIRNAADLDDGRLRLLEHEFFVDGADFGGFFPCLLAANAVFFGRG